MTSAYSSPPHHLETVPCSCEWEMKDVTQGWKMLLILHRVHPVSSTCFTISTITTISITLPLKKLSKICKRSFLRWLFLKCNFLQLMIINDPFFKTQYLYHFPLKRSVLKLFISSRWLGSLVSWSTVGQRVFYCEQVMTQCEHSTQHDLVITDCCPAQSSVHTIE